MMTDGPRFLVLVADYPWPMVSGSRVRAAGIIEALRNIYRANALVDELTATPVTSSTLGAAR